jgi:hypothetical protein
VQILPAAWKIVEDSCADPELEVDSAILFLSLYWSKAAKVGRYDNSKDLVSVLNSSRGGDDEFAETVEANANSASHMQKLSFGDMKAKVDESRKIFYSSSLKLDLYRLQNDPTAKVAVEKYRQALSWLGERNDNMSIRLLAVIHSHNFSSSCLLGLEDQSTLSHLKGLGRELDGLIQAQDMSEEEFFEAKIDDGKSLDVFLPGLMEMHELKCCSGQLAAFSVHVLQQSFAGVDVEMQRQDFVECFRAVAENSKAAAFLVGFLHKLFQSLAQTPLCQVARYTRLTILISELIESTKHMFTSFEPISVISDRDQVVDTVLFGSFARYSLLLQQSADLLRRCQVFSPTFEGIPTFSHLENPQRPSQGVAEETQEGEEVVHKHVQDQVQPLAPHHVEEECDEALEC